MADPISIIGTVGLVANIIDVVGKTNSTIRELRNDWKEADLTFLSLTTQLTALRAALIKIKEWMDSDLGDARYHKAKLALGGKNVDNIQKLIEQQTSALTLLLTACNCKTISEQKGLLEKSSTRNVLRRMELDSASLLVHRDSASLISQWTDNLSKLSAIFSFDRELFVSKIYERAFRGSIKESLRRQQGDTQAKVRSQAIDRGLEQDSRRLRRECKVLLLGTRESGKSEIVTRWKSLHPNGYTAQELALWRPTVSRNLVSSAQLLIRAMEQFKIHPEQEGNRAHCDFLLDYSVDPDPDKPLETKVGEAFSSIWHDPCISRIFERSDEFDMMDSAPYFFTEAKRIGSPDYVTRPEDLFRARAKSSGIHETRFTMVS
ncbi:guanine nucleotide-binding protein subunit alpha, other [Cladophialophora psammophila CBS 110553]|uniref:Guanine nucleotide-binding protein subunit alpha, other n=1 Tax=Cladophialophora psammophila CBS 110553 TaxID=1182543 RepID=W9WRI6_9EURO|nr:guanine nucleotide-binding protein subunit alpha, other [Cladophialophora psammophila CBS 110553]EXJ67286.1 guanine nucleotide-binding protein subunit alpha, other [Cladophialophora psammophila CBS 110553]